jgi:hypothetical protein
MSINELLSLIVLVGIAGLMLAIVISPIALGNSWEPMSGEQEKWMAQRAKDAGDSDEAIIEFFGYNPLDIDK